MEKTMTKEEWNELLEAKIAMEIEYMWQYVESDPEYYKERRVVFDNCTREEIEARLADEIKKDTTTHNECILYGVTKENFWEWDESSIDYVGTVLNEIYIERFETEEERRERKVRQGRALANIMAMAWQR